MGKCTWCARECQLFLCPAPWKTRHTVGKAHIYSHPGLNPCGGHQLKKQTWRQWMTASKSGVLYPTLPVRNLQSQPSLYAPVVFHAIVFVIVFIYSKHGWLATSEHVITVNLISVPFYEVMKHYFVFTCVIYHRWIILWSLLCFFFSQAADLISDLESTLDGCNFSEGNDISSNAKAS